MHSEYNTRRLIFKRMSVVEKVVADLAFGLEVK